MEKVITTCPYCGSGCSYFLCVEDGKVIGVAPNRVHPISKGRLCVKGWNAHEFVHHPGRLTKPLIRKGGNLVEASWDEALDMVANRLKGIKEKSGSDSIGVLSSAKCTNEENFVMMKFARAVIGTNNVDHCARLCHASTVAGLARAFGSGAMTNSIDELEHADVILVTGSNTIEQHPLIAVRILKAVRDHGAKLILVDPRSIQLSKFAVIHAKHKPGTDVAWINGVMNVIINEGLADEEFIKTRTEGFEEMKKLVMDYTPEKVEEITTIPADTIREIARTYARASAASIVYSMGITQHTTGTDNVLSCANLAMITGNVGKPSTGVNPLRGQNNVQGACDLGALPVVYSGYQSVADENVRKKFSEAWGAEMPSAPGLTVVEMVNAAADGKLKGLYIMGENPMLSDPDLSHVKEGLEKLEFLVVQDIFLTETAELADVVLPAESYAEKTGTFTNTERRVQLVNKAVEAPGEARPDWDIVSDVARRMGYDMKYNSAEDIMTEINKLTPSYTGITYQRIRENWGLAWPCPTLDHPGTPYLHKDKFTRGLGSFHAVPFKPPAEETDDEYPFILSTGRMLEHFHTGTMTRRSDTLDREVPKGFIEMNPKDADAIGVRNNWPVRVTTRRGSVVTTARVTDGIPEKMLFMPFHFREAAANMLTNPALDPIAKIPEFKVCAATVEGVQ